MSNTTDSSTPNSITTLNSTTSPLLLLPGELRNQIWEHTLGYNTYHIQRAPNTFYDVCLSTPFPQPLALLLTCRQIHSEAHALPLALSTFSFSVFGVCQDFSTSLSEHQRRAIKAVAIGPDFEAWGWYWFVRHVKENAGASVRDVFPGVGEVVVDEGLKGFDVLRPHWRHSLGEDAGEMKGLLMKWLGGGDGSVEVRFGVVRGEKWD